MKKLILLISSIVSLFVFSGATCSPISPPAFSPSRTLKAQKEGDVSVKMFGGAATQVFDLSGVGIGLEADYRAEENTEVVFGISGAKGEDDLENNHSVFQTGAGIVKYFLELNDDSYLFAFEPRIDFVYITNGTVSAIPNLVIHTSYRYGLIEPKLTLRAGSSLILSRGDEVNVDKPVSGPAVYRKDFLKDIIYGGGDLGILFHFGRLYTGPVLGVMYTKSLKDCEECTDLWMYYLINAGVDF